MKWWREARFGMMIHWGLYSIPAGEWNRQDMEYNEEWIMSRFHIPVPEYEKFAWQFNPVKFDAEIWVEINSNDNVGLALVSVELSYQ